MASILMMIGGAVLNASAFVDGSYLAKYLSDNNHDPDAERERHEKAVEQYQNDHIA